MKRLCKARKKQKGLGKKNWKEQFDAIVAGGRVPPKKSRVRKAFGAMAPIKNCPKQKSIP